MAMPMAVLGIGIAALTRAWRRDEHLRDDTLKAVALFRFHAAALLIAGATTAAACILAVVALHVLTD